MIKRFLAALGRAWRAYMELVRAPDECEHGRPRCIDCGGKVPGDW